MSEVIFSFSLKIQNLGHTEVILTLPGKSSTNIISAEIPEEY